MTDGSDWKGFSFGELEVLLTTSMQIDRDRRATFVSRLKQWQKMGFPEIEKVGKGAKAAYSLEHVFQLQLLIRLLALGLSPERGIRMIKQHWPNLRSGLMAAFKAVDEEPEDSIFAFFYADALGEIVRTKLDKPSYAAVQAGDVISAVLAKEKNPEGLKEIAKLYEVQPKAEAFLVEGYLRASAMIELTDLIRRTVGYTETQLPHVYDHLHLAFARMEATWKTWVAELPPSDPAKTEAKLADAIEDERLFREDTARLVSAIARKVEAINVSQKA